jgi:hypothetical protein
MNNLQQEKGFRWDPGMGDVKILAQSLEEKWLAGEGALGGYEGLKGVGGFYTDSPGMGRATVCYEACRG